MRPFEINRQSGNLEILAIITDSMVNEYECRVKYNKHTGEIDLIGEQYCYDVVQEVVNTSMLASFLGS